MRPDWYLLMAGLMPEAGGDMMTRKWIKPGDSYLFEIFILTLSWQWRAGVGRERQEGGIHLHVCSPTSVGPLDRGAGGWLERDFVVDLFLRLLVLVTHFCDTYILWEKLYCVMLVLQSSVMLEQFSIWRLLIHVDAFNVKINAVKLWK